MPDLTYSKFEWMTEDILKVSFSDRVPSAEEFETFLENLESYLVRNEGLVLIFDELNENYLPGLLKMRLGNWIKEHKEGIRRTFVKWCFVINSPIVKFLLQGTFLIQKPPVAYTIHESLAEAIAEAKNSQLALIGV